MLLLPVAAAHAVQGVSRDEIRVGTIQDLSGPIALLGVPIRDGMQMRFDEANAARRRARPQAQADRRGLGLRSEERRAGGAQADRQRPGVRPARHAGHAGGAGDACRWRWTRGVRTLFPFSPHPRHLRAGAPGSSSRSSRPMCDYMRTAAAATWCAPTVTGASAFSTRTTSYGLEVLRGAELALQDGGLELAGEDLLQARRHRLLGADRAPARGGCDLVVLGTVVRETVGAMQEARKVGWNVDMLVIVLRLFGPGA
ncbi:MAG: hypothetical protein MZW92_64790 [Comamonadaceae bacterium]|nr:hypothetical protein [Comamonadaceae bacterium]